MRRDTLTKVPAPKWNHHLGLDLVTVRAKVPLEVAEWLEARAARARRDRQDEAGLYLDDWAERTKGATVELLTSAGFCEADVEVRCVVQRSTRESLQRAAAARRLSMQGQAGLLLETWYQRKG